MIALLLFVIVGIAGAFFATQNVTPVSVTLVQTTLRDVPLYIIVLGSMLLGVFISSLISLFTSFFTTFTLYGKDAALRSAHRKIQSLENDKQTLENEIEKLKLDHQQGTNTHPSVLPHFHSPINRA